MNTLLIVLGCILGYFGAGAQIEVARVHGDEPPEKLMKAVDRAHEMVQTLALTGVA